MTYLETILREICVELNKNYSQVERFKKILEDEWIDNQEAIKITKEEELTKIGIPKMLAKKLKEKAEKTQKLVSNII